jgi:Ras-related protein Rab-11A
MNFSTNDKMENFDHDHVIKVVFIGDSGVGKTNILSRYCRDEFMLNSQSTIGVEFASKTISLDNGKIIKTQIWDTAGQERYKSVTNTYYYRSQGALVVFDITKPSSFKSVDRWVSQLREFAGNDVVIVIVGNKSDLRSLRAITKEEALEKASALGDLDYIETSALSNCFINDTFNILVKSKDMKIIIFYRGLR